MVVGLESQSMRSAEKPTKHESGNCCRYYRKAKRTSNSNPHRLYGVHWLVRLAIAWYYTRIALQRTVILGERPQRRQRKASGLVKNDVTASRFVDRSRMLRVGLVERLRKFFRNTIMASNKSVFLFLFLALMGSELRSEEQVTEPFLGVTLQKQVRDLPRPLVVWVAKIDLSAEGISFRITPGNGDPNGSKPGDPNGETTKQTTLDFLKEQKAQLAINAAFFGLKGKITDNVGLLVSDGELISPFRGKWPSINISADNQVRIIRGKHNSFEVKSPKQGEKLYNAVSGSDQILTDGKVTTNSREFSITQNPRTAIGFTSDKKLVLIVVDGRQAEVSEGVSLEELAKFMKELGCVQSINLDGGGSTTMAIADPEPRVLNTPSSRNLVGQPGVLRKNGANLAIFARPNPGYQRSGKQ